MLGSVLYASKGFASQDCLLPEFREVSDMSLKGFQRLQTAEASGVAGSALHSSWRLYAHVLKRHQGSTGMSMMHWRIVCSLMLRLP